MWMHESINPGHTRSTNQSTTDANQIESTRKISTDALFAMCPVKEGSVERCVDSSRYFVLKIQNAQGMCVSVACRG